MIAQTPDPNPIVQLAPLLLLVGIFYFLLIRPQQRRMRQQRTLIEGLDVGDEVLTIGGMFGTITGGRGRRVRGRDRSRHPGPAR